MFRNQVHRLTSVRFNSSTSAGDIDALLERVKNLTKGFAETKNSNQINRPKPNLREKYTKRSINHGEITQAMDDFSTNPSNQNKNFNNNNRRQSYQRNNFNSNNQQSNRLTPDEFRSQQRKSLTTPPRPVNIDRPTERIIRGRTERPERSERSPRVQRAPRDFNGERTDFARGAPRSGAPRGGPRGGPRNGQRNGQRGPGGSKGGARGSKNAKNFKQRRSTGNDLPAVNLNLQNVVEDYKLQVPTLQELLKTSPLLSHDEHSRILKTIRSSLNHNSASHFNANTVFKGDLQKIDLSKFESHLKNKNLKFNASIVANSLDKNNTIDYETKLKILGPLIGAASAKDLPSPSINS
ncbi:Chromosomal replication initiator protein dnaA [Wickerhamomyces ciferrii]|uniref:Chromosomal replication initiator protein dnaA n=1 Tax=Wickerhamomyces ciferrii (strain ATCC 14091 / BCRC 22168 / CBS 111 / JCM 3599 / NBRC 0793 / NRRL Y-1031 F-60-10) TaxID=1206466 RepID=K0KKF0_WICCF|nr:Chromosomal replication initiator protein dnaA [Wickerhamomyces ciferrii]CCH43436.1 Chromosomal replication initiator protein dnaA [Wickerhamomyces ciferrii]